MTDLSSEPETWSPDRCVLCGGPNNCGMAANNGGACWCFSTLIPAEALERVPIERRNVACICQACATSYKDSEATEAATE